MGVHRGKDNELYIDYKSFNYKTLEDAVKETKFEDRLFAKLRMSKQQLQKIQKKQEPVSYQTLIRLVKVYPKYTIKDFLLDYTEEEYDDLDLDLGMYMPTIKELKELQQECNLRKETIRSILKGSTMCIEKQEKIMYQVERLMLDEQYFGIMLNLCGLSYKVTEKLEKLRKEKL